MNHSLVIQPFTSSVCGIAEVPGSKSITNRALIFASLSHGTTTLTGALFSRDTRILITALRSLGFNIEDDEALKVIRVTGLGGSIPNRRAQLHVGNAGTAARFLTAMLALVPDGIYELDGDAAMRVRPMRGLLEALSGAGCRAVLPDGSSAQNFPFTLHTTGSLGSLEVDASASSQLLSALLMILPLAPQASVRMKGTTVSEPFVEMTVQMCAQFGRPIHLDHSGTWKCPVPGAYDIPHRVYAIEPDATAASYFLALPAVIPAPSAIRIEGYATKGLQGDTAFSKIAALCGAKITQSEGAIVAHSWSGIRGGDFNFNAFSDTFLTLATLAALADSPVTIRGIGHTRKQETDRVLAMATELERIGIIVTPSSSELRNESTLSSLTIYPNREALRIAASSGPVTIQTYEDHRMAMSFAILGSFDLFGDGRPWLAIQDPSCTGKTFPRFFIALDSLRKQFVRVSVDGGAASGKSSTSRRLALEHGLLHVDTGAHYRSLTRALLIAGISTEDSTAVESGLLNIQLGSQLIKHSGAYSSVATLNEKLPADEELRTPQVNIAVSLLAAQPAVRAFLLNYQRSQIALAASQGFAGIIMEGRDIGSVVMPEAEVRIFLEADENARASRRKAEGQSDIVMQRDLLDSTRKTAPLICPEGAYRLNNTHLTKEEVVAEVGQLIRLATMYK